MESHPNVPQYAVLLRAAQNRLLLAVFALCLGAGLLTWTKAHSDSAGRTLVCVGSLSEAPGTQRHPQSVEFTLPFSANEGAPLEPDLRTLDAPLRLELDGTTVWEGSCTRAAAPEKKKKKKKF
jgi:hypothetical protein